MSDTLERLIVTIESRIATVDQTYGDTLSALENYEKWQERQSAFKTIINDLVAGERAKHRVANGTYELVMSGIRTSCTAGDYGLLVAWVRKARGQIELAKAGAA